MIDSTHTQINKSTAQQGEVLVKVERVSKKFCKDLKRSLWYGIRDIASDLFGLKKNQELRKDEFWAVNDVSFELRRGECLGLIGHNGAGKSTLLKMLNGLINPDKGKITMKGRIGALIELGAGFNPILTGRENVFNNGAVLGFSQKEIAAKYKAIVEFAELEEFMDTPVQNYSSGMKVRLGFAVAAQMEPDVLIIDEVLAVGDVGFRAKCFNFLYKILNRAVVIFVSHSMLQISRICTRGVLLERGKKLLDSNQIKDVTYEYISAVEDSHQSTLSSGGIELISAKLCTKENVGIEKVHHQDEIKIKLELIATVEITFTVSVIFFNREQRAVYEYICPIEEKLTVKPSNYDLEVEIPPITLSAGKYYALIEFRGFDKHIILRANSVLKFMVESKYISGAENFKKTRMSLNEVSP